MQKRHSSARVEVAAGSKGGSSEDAAATAIAGVETK